MAPVIYLDTHAMAWLIVSQASLRDAPLLTKDRKIHQHYSGAVWTAALT